MKRVPFTLVIGLITISFVLLFFTETTLSQQPSMGVSGGVPDIQGQATASFTYQLLSQKVALWADGRGDLILEEKLRNETISNWSYLTWYFDWPSANYSKIRAWDDDGPLEVSTSLSGTRIYVTTYFRKQLQPGEVYDFSLAITIGNMASRSGNSWRANWSTRPGSPVQSFVEGVTFPLNSTIQSASPTPTKQEDTYLEWSSSNTQSDWQLTIDVPYTLSDKIDVPLFLQTSPPWNDDPYGRYPGTDTVNTISKWGCYMTSGAMIINYYEQKSHASTRTDPGILNAWLREKDFYDGNNGFNFTSAQSYASDKGFPLYIPEPGTIAGRTTASDATLNDSLRSGNPVILEVSRSDSPNGRHFVVATGRTADTYEINDPTFGKTTLAARYNNQYTSIKLFSGTPAEQRMLSVSAHSPVELLITDPQGRKTGYDAQTSTSWNQIPNARYFTEAIAPNPNTGYEDVDEAKVLFIYAPIDGKYSLKIFGTDDGTYEIDTFASNWRGQMSKQVSTGEATQGSVYLQTINYSSYTGVNSFIYLPLIVK